MARLFVGINDGTVIDADRWTSLLRDRRFVEGNYSLGSVLEQRGGVDTVGHSGGGARANVRYSSKHRTGVMVCTHDRQNHGLAITLARMLIAEIANDEAPRWPVLVALKDYETMSGSAIAEAYYDAQQHDERYDLSDSEGVLNMMGYTLLSQSRIDDEIRVFETNVEQYTRSPNTHDSLGEALLEAGRYQESLAAYKRVIALDPGNEHARAAIDRLSQFTDP